MCKEEFQLKYFGFAGASPELFHRLPWTPNRYYSFIYRMFMTIYSISWIIADFFVDTRKNFWQFLSKWAEYLVAIYFTYSLGVSVYALKTKPEYEKNREQPLSWFYRINWILYNVASGATFCVTFLFWVLLAKDQTVAENLRPTSFHIHAITAIMVTVDAFMISFPVRFLHFIHAAIFAFIYGTFALILHATNVNSRIYKVLDFENKKELAYGLVVAAFTIFPLIFHAIVYLLYRIRNYIAMKRKLSYLSNNKTKPAPDSSQSFTGTASATNFNLPSKPTLFPIPEISIATIISSIAENVSIEIVGNNDISSAIELLESSGAPILSETVESSGAPISTELVENNGIPISTELVKSSGAPISSGFVENNGNMMNTRASVFLEGNKISDDVNEPLLPSSTTATSKW